MPLRNKLRALLAGFLLAVAGTAAAQTPVPAPPPVSPTPAALPMPAPRIGVVTMEPGEIFFERFGHNAIVVDARDGSEPLAYNFGYFDLDEPNFFGNFVNGNMQYWLVALPLRQDMERYRQLGRGAAIQWLDLTPQQATTLAASLVTNARVENARYRYDYYTSNCSTKVRDALDDALGGILKSQLSGRSQGNTYRSESVRLAAPAPWMAIGFHVGLSDYADRPLSRWEESFIPMRLRDALREVKLPDGRPLVSGEEPLLPHRVGQPPAEAPRLRGAAFVTGLVLAGLALWTGRHRPRLLAGAALVFWSVSGLAGALMLFIWLGSAHVAGHGNENLLLLSPLCLLLLPGGWATLRGREPSPRFRVLLVAVAACAVLAGFLKFLPFRPQQNVEWVLLLLPLHWALLRVFAPKR